jgi:hypothetical protein
MKCSAAMFLIVKALTVYQWTSNAMANKKTQHAKNEASAVLLCDDDDRSIIIAH